VIIAMISLSILGVYQIHGAGSAEHTLEAADPTVKALFSELSLAGGIASGFLMRPISQILGSLGNKGDARGFGKLGFIRCLGPADKTVRTSGIMSRVWSGVLLWSDSGCS
jgi:hypothetical protein